MTDLKDLKDKIAVIGVGNTSYGNFPAHRRLRPRRACLPQRGQ